MTLSLMLSAKTRNWAVPGTLSAMVTVKVPLVAGAPGANVPLTVTLPALPVPPRVAPESTVTALPEAMLPLMISVPLLTVVALE